MRIHGFGPCYSIQKDGRHSSKETSHSGGVRYHNDWGTSDNARKPRAINAPMDLVSGFRIASAFAMGVLWGLLGIIPSAFWDKFKPHELADISVR